MKKNLHRNTFETQHKAAIVCTQSVATGHHSVFQCYAGVSKLVGNRKHSLSAMHGSPGQHPSNALSIQATRHLSIEARKSRIKQLWIHNPYAISAALTVSAPLAAPAAASATSVASAPSAAVESPPSDQYLQLHAGSC